MSAIGASMGFFFTGASAFRKLKEDRDGGIFLKTMAALGVAFSVVFMVLQLIPIPGLSGVHFCKESYLMLVIWVALGLLFYFTKSRSFRHSAG